MLLQPSTLLSFQFQLKYLDTSCVYTFYYLSSKLTTIVVVFVATSFCSIRVVFLFFFLSTHFTNFAHI